MVSNIGLRVVRHNSGELFHLIGAGHFSLAKTLLVSAHIFSDPPHITSVQYCGGCSVHWRLFSTSEDNISTVGDSFSTVGDSFSTVGDASVLWRLFSAVGDSFSTMGG